MRRKMMLKGSVIAAGLSMLLAHPAQAQTQISTWEAELLGEFDIPFGTCRWTWTQKDSSLTMDDSDCYLFIDTDGDGEPDTMIESLNGSFLGFIDETSGLFQLVGSQWPCVPGTAVFTGYTDGEEIPALGSQEDAVWWCDQPANSPYCETTDPCILLGKFTATRLPDSDEDGVPDADDRCLGWDDNVDNDGDGFVDPPDPPVPPPPLPNECDVCLGGDDRVDADQDGFPDDCDIDMTGSWDVETFAGPCTTWVVTETGIDPDGIDLKMNAECVFCKWEDINQDGIPECVVGPVIGVGRVHWEDQSTYYCASGYGRLRGRGRGSGCVRRTPGLQFRTFQGLYHWGLRLRRPLL